MTQDNFPVDILAVREYGIDRWQQDFFWPVGDMEFIDLHKEIDRFLAGQVQKESEEVNRLLIIQYNHLVFEYENFLHALKVVQKIQKLKKGLSYSEKNQWYRNIIRGESACSYAKWILPSPVQVNILDSAIEYIKTVAKSLIYNRADFLKYLFFFNGEKTIKACGTIIPLMQSYIRSIDKWASVTSWRDWIDKGVFGSLPGSLLTDVKRCTEDIVSRLTSIVQKEGISWLDKDIVYLRNFTMDRLTETAKVLRKVEDKVKRYRKKIHILLPNIKVPIYRIISLAIQRFGGEVTTFAHGGDIGLLNSPLSLISPFDIPVASDFVTYTEESAELYRRIKRNHSRCRDNRLNIISAESDEFLKLWKRYRKNTLPYKNKKIMVMGSPHYQWRQPIVGGPSLVRLDLELRIVDLLKRAGYDVIYKVHPDKIKEVEGIFDGKVEILKGYFERQFDRADVFIFPRITSSAFTIALCTNKPVVILDISFKSSEPFHEALELLKKRCSIIETHFDGRNRIIFDEDALLSVLAKKPREPNIEFLEKYLFPKDKQEKIL